jgi:hypothetical protein
MSAYLEHVRHLATHFEKLRGLREALVGLFLLATAVLQPIADRRGGGLERKLPVLLPALLVFVGLQLLVNRYYRRRFGSVVARKAPGASVGEAILGIAMLAWMLMAIVADYRLEGTFGGRPVLVGLTIAAWLTVRWGRVPERRHYLWFAAATVAAGLFPWPQDSQVTYMCLMLGGSSFAGGILDHLALLRLTKRVGEESRAEAL